MEEGGSGEEGEIRGEGSTEKPLALVQTCFVVKPNADSHQLTVTCPSLWKLLRSKVEQWEMKRDCRKGGWCGQSIFSLMFCDVLLIISNVHNCFRGREWEIE